MNGLGRRIARLESERGDGMDYLPIFTVHDFVISEDSALVEWPDDLAGVRFADGKERPRRDGENGEAFRQRLSVEHSVRGPVGALPYAVVDLIRL